MIAKKPLSLLIAINMLFVLGACGGGGGSSSSSSPVVTASSLKVFEDGAGVAVLQGVSNGRKVLILSPVITDVVASASSLTSVPSGGNYSLTASGNTATATIKTGTYTSDGITGNITEYTDNGGEAAIMLLEVPSVLNAVYAGGSTLNGTPSGTYTYSGLHAFGRRAVGVTPELGSFSMSANFTNGTFSYSGTTASSSLTGSGAIDASAGQFTSTQMTLTAPTLPAGWAVGTTNYSASLYGLLHGTNASAVSGVYHSNDTYPDYAGAFVGAR
jgi:hypothetical protein